MGYHHCLIPFTRQHNIVMVVHGLGDDNFILLMNGDVFNYTFIHELKFHPTKDGFMLTHENSV